MEIMVLPHKETLIFLKQIDSWVSQEEITNDGVVLTFHRDTPEKIISLFETIKNKLDFRVKKYVIAST